MSTIRNVFHQYSQPENKLTHAFYCVLNQDRQLIRRFLEWIGGPNIPPTEQLHVTQQSVPGLPIEASDGNDGLPDLCIYTDDGWGVFFEIKAQSKLKFSQIKRHSATAKRFGFEDPIVVAVTVDPLPESFNGLCLSLQWRQLYGWFAATQRPTFWTEELVRYFEIFEERAIDNQYEIRGTITMFNGLRFRR